MGEDDLDRACADTDEAFHRLARYPSTANSSRARRALRRLQEIVRDAAGRRLWTEQVDLADGVRRNGLP